MDEDINYWPTLLPFQQLTSLNDSQLQNQSTITIINDNDTSTYTSHLERRKRLMVEYFNVSFHFCS